MEGLRRSFGVAMAVHASWWVEFSGGGGKPQRAAATTTFTFSDRHILAIAPIHEVIGQLLASQLTFFFLTDCLVADRVLPTRQTTS